MGTRADFYVGRGNNAEWLGSIGWDGYPDGIDDEVLAASDELVYRSRLESFSKTREDWTAPERGWPWPWEDSNTSDFAYAFDEGRVWASAFGRSWYAVTEERTEEETEKYWDSKSQNQEFPNMKERMNLTLGQRSGLMIIGAK